MDFILTLDYEISGDGQGNVVDHVIRSTKKLLEICNKYNIKITIFFEVAEYWKFKEANEKGFDLGYDSNPAKLIEDQIVAAYKDGHDIQLHLHPQWLGAIYENQKWTLSHQFWRLPNVPMTRSNSCELGLFEFMKLGKNLIEDLIKPVDDNYECLIFRAGGLNIFPSNNIIPVMRSIGLVADSSVFPNGFLKGDYAFFDYRSIDNSLPYWYTKSNNILDLNNDENAASKIFELPIFSADMRRFRKYEVYRLKSMFKSIRNSIDTIHKYKDRTRSKSKLVFFLEKEGVMWDFCLLSFSRMKVFLNQARKIKQESNFEFHPFVLIGHSNDFNNPSEFERFIKYCLNYKEPINFLTLIEAYQKIKKDI